MLLVSQFHFFTGTAYNRTTLWHALLFGIYGNIGICHVNHVIQYVGNLALGLPLAGNSLPGYPTGYPGTCPVVGPKYVNLGCRAITMTCVVQSSGGHPSEGFRAKKTAKVKAVTRSQWSSGSMPDCSARGPRIESRCRQLCLSHNHCDL